MSLDRVDNRIIEVLKSALPEGAATEETLLAVAAALTALNSSTEDIEAVIEDGQVIRGGEPINRVFDLDSYATNREMLNELRIINLHLSSITDNEFKEKDI